MIKRLFLYAIGAFFPWLIFLIYDNPTGAIIALLLQATIIGWFPATLWSWKTIYLENKPRRKK